MNANRLLLRHNDETIALLEIVDSKLQHCRLLLSKVPTPGVLTPDLGFAVRFWFFFFFFTEDLGF